MIFVIFKIVIFSEIFLCFDSYCRSRVNIGPSLQGKYENSYVRTALLYQKGQNIGFYMIVVLVFQGLSEILFYS